LRSAAAIAAAGLLAFAGIGPVHLSAARSPGGSDRQEYRTIQKLAADKKYGDVKTRSARFFKAHPGSPHVPDVRLVLAEIEASPDEAISKYRAVVSRYPRYGRRHLAQYRICEIAFLQSKWDVLAREAREGQRLGKSPHDGKFGRYLVIALIHTGDYADAERECRRLIDTDHEYETMARSLLLLAHILRSASGFSREYIAAVRDIALGYAGSDAIQAVLYLLGEFYESRKMYDESYSAYSDLVSKYPGSPEAAEASRRMKGLMKHGPRRVAYLPGRKILDSTENIDIHPEKNLPEEDASAAFYSISVGPLASSRKAAELKGLLKEFDFLRTVKLRDGFALYVGRGPDEESALKLKVRLAEEYGINGRIVRISGDGDRSYIYGE